MTRKEREELRMLKRLRAYLNDKGKERMIILLIAREDDLKRQIAEYEA